MGDCYFRYLFFIMKSRKLRNEVRFFLDDAGNVITDFVEIIRIFIDFFKDIYRADCINLIQGFSADYISGK